MHRRVGLLTLALLLIQGATRLAAQEGSVLPPVPTPTDVKPGSITCDECPYPYPSKYLDIRVYTQDVRISYMDVAPQGAANGHTVLLLHGNNFGGFYFKAIIDGLTKEGFRVIVPDQIGALFASVRERHIDLCRIFHDVAIGKDQAVGREDESGSGARLRRRPLRNPGTFVPCGNRTVSGNERL